MKKFCFLVILTIISVSSYAQSLDYDTKTVISDFSNLISNMPIIAQSSDYESAKDLISKAKSIYKDKSDIDKLNLRYVRFSTNLILSVSNVGKYLKKSSYTAKKAAQYYFAVAVKDLAIAAYIYKKNKSKYSDYWNNVKQVYLKVKATYANEFKNAVEIAGDKIEKIKRIIDDPDSVDESEDE